jgi:hypothetical protein
MHENPVGISGLWTKVLQVGTPGIGNTSANRVRRCESNGVTSQMYSCQNYQRRQCAWYATDQIVLLAYFPYFENVE